jgi:hypothetical protein
MSIEWQPTRQDAAANFLQWRLPAPTWPDAEHSEDMIIVNWQNGEWDARTEVDQCVHRDLDSEQIANVRQVFGLDQWLPEDPAAKP